MRTVSVIKADVGSNAGHLRPTPELVAAVEDVLADEGAFLDDYFVFTVGDDVDIVMSHTRGEDDDEVHRLAWDAFEAGTEVAKEQGLYGAGQDLLEDAFAGNVRGLGPGVCELTFEEREAEPFLVFGADKTEPGAFNQPLYTAFADPRYTTGLLLKDTIHEGFTFQVMDLEHTDDGERRIQLDVPEDGWDLTALLMEPHRFGIEKIYSRATGAEVAAVSTQKLRNVAGEYVGKDDPVALVRTQADFPSPGEVLQPYATPPFVAGAMRGSHHGVFYPIESGAGEIPSYFDGPPLVKAIGMVLNDGEFSEPVYPFDASFWDSVREDAATRFREFRERQGAFGPGTVETSELEYGGWTDIMASLEDRWTVASEQSPSATDD
ncbi:fructose-1,6-bisphosphatase [Halomicroarcula sp. F13]|uniref:Fructose-1,6-bisphosphate aldolase/phosphatase n=1 Tax=Haloarcula rubra TaxID=2487747 RepID=A0AAW4PLT7_9EURY|nr:fructose 1,6-bisphosphatase [Halomicroarcula rubra]MBX0322037.1 fructose-1,6-bisphosphatase [Halomicroarcula rubra]